MRLSLDECPGIRSTLRKWSSALSNSPELAAHHADVVHDRGPEPNVGRLFQQPIRATNRSLASARQSARNIALLVLADAGIEVVKIQPRCPRANCHASLLQVMARLGR
jgi:hypothetical protein